MTNFTDAAHAAELASFAPVHETSGGRLIADRAQERIMTDADFAARQLPALDDWVRRAVAHHPAPGRRGGAGASHRQRATTGWPCPAPPAPEC
jgi:hypothetical protein